MSSSNLKHLLSAYFHEDWNEEYDGSWERAIDDFLLRSPVRAAEVPAEIDALLHEVNPSATLRKRLLALGNSRRAGDNDTAYRDWLLAVRDRIQAALDSTS